MSRRVIVQQGECMCSIARKFGFPDPQRLLGAPENEQICRTRSNLNVLAPGDEVFVPRIEPRTISVPASSETQVVLVSENVTVRMLLVDEFGNPWAGKKCELSYLDGDRSVITQGAVGVDGVAEFPVPAVLQSANFSIGLGNDNTSPRALMINIGHLDPINQPAGVQARLANLGYGCGVDGQLGPQTRAAIAAFQNDHGLASSGTMDEATRTKLTQIHGV